MKQVALKPERQFFANGDTPVQIGTGTPQSDVAGEFVVIGDRQMNSIKAPLGCRVCFHVIHVFRAVGRIERYLPVIQIRNAAEPKRPLHNPAKRPHKSFFNDVIQCSQPLHRMTGMIVQRDRVAVLALRVRTLAIGVVLNLPGRLAFHRVTMRNVQV
jgi:hypothetical protein